MSDSNRSQVDYSGVSGPAKRALDNLSSSLQSGATYEGHEMLKTAFYRMRSRKKLHESYDIARYGAMLQFAEGQLHCGIEMGNLFLESCLNDGMSVTSTAIEHACELLKAFPTRFDQNDLVKGMAKLKQGTLKWIVKCGGSVEDQRKVYTISGQYLASLLGWKGVNVFFSDVARSGDAELLLSVLQDTIRRLRKDEMELFITRICLQVFASMPQSRKGEAFSMVDSLQRNFEGYKQPSASNYLFDFIQLLVQGLRQGSWELCTLLLDKYEDILKANDPDIERLAEDIVTKYCPAPPGYEDGFGSMLGNMLRTLG